MPRFFRTLLTLALAVTFSAVTNSAHAQTLTFEDLDCRGEGLELTTYAGFTWANTDCLNGADYGELTSGYYTAGSGSNVVYGAFADPFGWSSESQFNLLEFRAAPAWHNGLQVSIAGYLGGEVVHSIDLVLSGPSTPQQIVLNWFGIDQVVFTTSGGTEAPETNGAGEHLALDNIMLSTGMPGVVVPEPSTLTLLTIGTLTLLLTARRRTRRTHKP